MSARDRLAELGLTMPAPPQPAGAYTRATRAGELIFVAGQLPLRDGGIAYAGKVGDDLSVDEGYAACQLCALNALSILEAEIGSLDEVKQIVRMSGFRVLGNRIHRTGGGRQWRLRFDERCSG